jgi:hypothetical protein
VEEQAEEKAEGRPAARDEAKRSKRPSPVGAMQVAKGLASDGDDGREESATTGQVYE